MELVDLFDDDVHNARSDHDAVISPKYAIDRRISPLIAVTDYRVMLYRASD